MTDPSAAQRVIDFIGHLSHTKGEWAGCQFELLPWQTEEVIRPFFGTLRKDGGRRYRICYVEIPKKNGKLLDLKTPIPTPAGWTTIGDLSVNDVVFDIEGKRCLVTGLSEIETNPETYEIEFTNGEKIKACADHLWMTTALVNRPNGQKEKRVRRRKRPSLSVNKRGYAYINLHRRQKYLGKADDPDLITKFVIEAKNDLTKYPFNFDLHTRRRTTKEIFDTTHFGKNKTNNHRLQMPSPIDTEFIKLPVDPYYLGVWLGDGTRRTTAITCHINDYPHYKSKFESVNYKIISTKKRRPSTITFSVNNGSRGKLRKALIELKVTEQKHIPSTYLRASINQRLALLQGLIDTDGYVSKNGKEICYYSTCKILTESMCELLATFGLKYRTRKGRAKLNGKDCGPKYSIQFSTHIEHLCVCSLPRKAGRLRSIENNKLRPRCRSVQIKNVTHCKSVAMRCIAVSSPTKQFLVGKTMLPTHNSELGAALALYFLTSDHEASPEVYSAAADRDQASLVYNVAAQMVRADPIMSKVLQVRDSRRRIINPRNAGFYQVLSAEVKTKHGLNPSAIIFDELHAQPNDELWRVLTAGTDYARKQQAIVVLTTAGIFNRESIWWRVREKARQIRDGIVEDPAFLPVLYIADPDKDNPEDEELWKRVNPSLGRIFDLDRIRRDYQTAKNDLVELEDFKRFRLNIPAKHIKRWMPMQAWDKCGGALDEDLAGRPCYGGLDLSSTIDLSALALVWPPTEEGEDWQTFVRCYCPEDTVRERARQDRVDFSRWLQTGEMVATSGNVIDYAYIKRDILDVADAFDLREVGFDPWNAAQLATDLLNNEGIQMVEVRQGAKTLSEPAKDILKTVLAGALRHGGNPVLRWCTDNLVMVPDANENIRPVKDKSSDRIDAFIAMLIAWSRAIVNLGMGPNVYESRGIVTLG